MAVAQADEAVAAAERSAATPEVAVARVAMEWTAVNREAVAFGEAKAAMTEAVITGSV